MISESLPFPKHILLPAGACLAGCVAGGLLMKKIIQSTNGADQLPEKWMKVGEIKEIRIYPVKSIPPTSVNAAIIQDAGFIDTENPYLRDRVFVAMNEQTGKSVKMGIHLKLALARAKIEGSKLHLSHADDQSLKVTIDIASVVDKSVKKVVEIFGERVPAIDCGDDAAALLNEVTGATNLRLMYHFQEVTQRGSVKRNTRFHTYRGSHAGTFHDETSYMLMTEESVAALNDRLEIPVSQDNFRGTIIASGIPEPFAEDFWGYIRIGDKDNGPVLKTSRPCIRCSTTTVDPTKGIFREDGEPLRTLNKMRRPVGDTKITKVTSKSPVLGTHFGVFAGSGKVVRVGDPIYAALL